MSYSKVEEGKLVRKGTEFDYIIEADEKNKIRLRVINEKPVIEKVRTRYDPEIELYGDKNAVMDVMLGYDVESINKTLKWIKYILLMPFVFTGFIIGSFKLIDYTESIPKASMPVWGKIALVVPLIALICLGAWVTITKGYFKLLAEYFRAKKVKDMLVKEGKLGG